MSTRRKILVSYDFDGLSDAALRVGADLAARSGRRLAVLHVLPTVADPDSPLHAEARGKLQALVPAGTEVLIRGGDPAAQIVAYADHARPDRIVMGTHQRGGLGRAWYGSVVQGVTRESMTPVLTVPNTSIEHMPSSRIVDCAVDFGPGTAAAIELAKEHARDMDAGLRLVHVVEPPLRMDGREVEVIATSLGRRLAELAENVRASAWTVIHGNAAELILATVRGELPVALVISGRDPTHSSWGTRSVTSRVIGGSPVPVLIAPGRASFGWRRGIRERAAESVS
jgi:nucleotide-binding universal stress UspA family protein